MSTRTEIGNRYFNWIHDLIAEGFPDIDRYGRLLRYLHNRDFEYCVPMDENRLIDGVGLRYRFGYDMNIPREVITRNLCGSINRHCSVLEMMAALCFRVEESIMSNDIIGNRTGFWFRNMIVNLGLRSQTDECFDEEYVTDCVDRLLNREYGRNGEGGLVTVHRPGVDMRDVEIWYQVMWYLNTFKE